ncbi:MAG: hypothetical protein R2873_35775 [Caldilineaceae bacterium]
MTPEGGWSNEIKEEDCVHTLIAVITDEDIVGYGSVFTSDHLVNGSLKLLAPLYLGENALEPERVSEKLHQHTFWQGAAALSPTPSAASTSPCGISGQGHWPARGPSAGWTLSRTGEALRLAVDGRT